MFLNGWKIIKIVFSDAWKLYKIHILVSPGRVLLEHSYACLCVVCICFHVTARVVVTEQLTCKASVWFSSVAPSCLTLWPHGRQHARPPCPSPTPGVYPNSCPLSWWCRSLSGYLEKKFAAHSKKIRVTNKKKELMVNITENFRSGCIFRSGSN